MCPPVGCSRRLSVLRKVDFPEPDGPTTTTTSPRCISIFIPLSTSISPKDFSRLSTLIIALLSVITLTQPPLKNAQKLCENHNNNEVYNSKAYVRNKRLICFCNNILCLFCYIPEHYDRYK